MRTDWEVFTHWAEELRVSLSQEQLDKLQTYHQLLINWNQKINLISRQDVNRIVSYHFIDSISAITEIPLKSSVCDLGAGAGLPGIPIKIIRDDITLYLIESIKKKGNFLSDVINTLKLNNTFLLGERAETIKNKKFDIILARLFGKIVDVLPLASKLLNKNGKVIFYKVEGVEAEIEHAKKTAEKSHFELKSITDIKLPVTEITRKLIIYTFEECHRDTENTEKNPVNPVRI